MSKFIGVQELTDLMKVTSRGLYVRRSREKARRENERAQGLPGEHRPTDLPEPLDLPGPSLIWDRATIMAWLEQRNDPGGRNKNL
ncbi:hypothetical protein [Zhihengliuella halotolerans]|uniref:hypothetical protein n=1 Tax=Zhihengliuella halotolerans TaxID=370736 RepID=UPI0011AF1B2B|nr:hypothetical protein [Zhihengliuella halotolerans]